VLVSASRRNNLFYAAMVSKMCAIRRILMMKSGWRRVRAATGSLRLRLRGYLG
jgi:hypothetical protein